MTIQTATHTCKHGCGYTAAKRGPMNLHELYHCPKIKQQTTPAADKPAAKGSKAKPADKPAAKCDCDDGPSYAFLLRNDPVHIAAATKGFKKYCTECGELF